MANEKNNNMLVADDDPTSELETLDLPMQAVATAGELETGESTFDIEKPVVGDARKISRLQYDVETLRSKWQGLEIELQAREALAQDLNAQIDELRDELAEKDTLIKERDREIKSLKSDISDRDELHRNSIASLEEQLESARTAIHEIPKPPALEYDSGEDATTSVRLRRSEEYADTLRRKFQDVVAAHDEADRDRQRLAAALAASEERVRSLERQLENAVEEHNRLDETLAGTLADHIEEIRMLRFELGEAQDTVVQAEELNAQLASDLVDTRSFRDDLERALNDAGEESRDRIETLERTLTQKTADIAELEKKLESRGEAVNLLLGELARKSEQIESISDIGEFVADINSRVSDPAEDGVPVLEPTQRSQDRCTRVLLGRVGDKLLRFPLFKDQTTIGRSDDNDIQLEAAYISRKHAIVRTEGESTRVIDWGSRNGVFVNSERVTDHLLSNGDIVTIGNAHFRYDELQRRDA